MQSDENQSPYAGLSNKIRGGKSAAALEHESRPPSLIVSRSSVEAGLPGRYAIFSLFERAVSSFPFCVELDGQVMGQLARGETLSLDINPGEHSLRITTPISKSKAKQLTAENGQRFRFLCQPTLTGIVLQQSD